MGLILKKISNHEKVKEAMLRFFSLSAMLLTAILSVHAFVYHENISGFFVLSLFGLLAANFVYYIIYDKFEYSVHFLIIIILIAHILLYAQSFDPAFTLFFYFTFPAISVVLAGNKYGTLYSIIPFLISLHPLVFPQSSKFSIDNNAILISFIFSYLAILSVINFTEFLRKKWHESYKVKMVEKNKYIIQIMDKNQEMKDKGKNLTKHTTGNFKIENGEDKTDNSDRERQPSEHISHEAINAIKKENIDLQQTIEIITEQQSKINEITKGMRDSLNYARSIQDAMLPSPETLKEILSEHFILYYPKEIVSGDFYYVNRVNDYLVAAVADCTGHGVPGGFLTMLGITFLHKIVSDPTVNSTGEVLNRLREQIKQIFSHFGSKNTDGLDIALVAINTETNEMQYSGAFNSLIIINKEGFTEYKPTRNPIGFYPLEEPFKTKTIELKDNDMLYMFSDGFADQPGGSELKRFSSRHFKELLYQIHASPIEKQAAMLENIYNNWRGSFEQIDDVSVMGIKWNINNN